MKVHPPASYSLCAAERLRLALFALAAGAAAATTGQAADSADDTAATTTNRQAVVPRAIDLDAQSRPMTPMLTTPRLSTAELQALRNMTPRPLSTFSPEELEQFWEEHLTPRAIHIELPDSAVADAISTATSNLVSTAAAGTATNAVPTAAEAAASQDDDAEKGEP